MKDIESLVENCILCGHRCGVNRLKGERGVCRAGRYAKISSFGPHFGEEPELVGRRGSGTIFFSFCNLKCMFCQNYEISQFAEGKEVSDEQLVEIMLYLQKIGCENINLVSPTHFLYPISRAIEMARKKGLVLPIVYNTGGYDSEEAIDALRGKIDIYMPDAKYADSKLAEELSGAKDYPVLNRKILKKMHEQVGDLLVENGIAIKGLLIRHLVLPGYLENSFKVLSFIAKEIGKNTYVNIMDQYYPSYKARGHPFLGRRLHVEEYQKVIEYARKLGLHRGFEVVVR